MKIAAPTMTIGRIDCPFCGQKNVGVKLKKNMLAYWTCPIISTCGARGEFNRYKSDLLISKFQQGEDLHIKSFSELTPSLEKQQSTGIHTNGQQQPRTVAPATGPRNAPDGRTGVHRGQQQTTPATGPRNAPDGRTDVHRGQQQPAAVGDAGTITKRISTMFD